MEELIALLRDANFVEMTAVFTDDWPGFAENRKEQL